MNQALQKKRGRRCLLLHNIDWRTYLRLLRAFAERPGVRLAYDDGDIEIMSPLLYHDDNSRFLFQLVVVLTEELGKPIRFGGSTTLKRRLKRKGIEADECFWIDNAPKMAGKKRLNLRKDPPPDLAIEIDVSRSSINRFGIYAGIRVPEIWRYERGNLVFYWLNEAGAYENAQTSRSFPGLRPADLLPFLLKAHEASDENAVIREFRDWVRSQPQWRGQSL
jgi:Uma2 family endonuclease